LGIARQISALRDGTIFSARSDGHKFAASGVAGGKEGATARLYRNHGTDREEALNSKVTHLVLKTGESIRIETPGAGGFGDPTKRDPEAIERDISDGLITAEAAAADYGHRG
jgi:N-methylhydantoinase B